MDYEKIRREYLHARMDLDSMDPDPMKVFQKWFDVAHKIFGAETTAMSLATADDEGRPSVRIVLLKGTTDRGFIFYTNYKSRKGSHLAANPRAALLFYWPGLDRQIRIEGLVTRLPDEVSESYFNSRPLGSRISAVVSPQSNKITLEELRQKRSEIENSESISRPPHWGGYELKSDYFEFWNGQENRFHDRFVYELKEDGSFDRYRIAP